nr:MULTISPECIES: hypothetical protein [unclassified Cyanobium]
MEEDDPVLLSFRRIHRQIGISEKDLGSMSMGGEDGDSKADLHPENLLTENKGLGNTRHHLLGYMRNIFRTSNFHQKADEFIPSPQRLTMSSSRTTNAKRAATICKTSSPAS